MTCTKENFVDFSTGICLCFIDSSAIDYDHLLLLFVSALPSGYSSQFSVTTSGPSADPNLPERDIYTATLSQVAPISRGNVRSFDLFIKVSNYNSKHLCTHSLCIN